MGRFAIGQSVPRFEEFNRVTHCTMEPRGCIGAYDYREDRYTLYSGNQRPHGLRNGIAGTILKIPETKLSSAPLRPIMSTATPPGMFETAPAIDWQVITRPI